MAPAVNPASPGGAAPASSRLAARALRLALHGIAFALLALYLVVFFAGNVGLQWDLRACLAAAKAALAGGNPYDLAQVSAVAGREVAFPFLYPPVALVPFMALGAMQAAAAVWLSLKLALLGALVALWRRVFVRDAPLLALVLIAVFGWNGAALWDLRAGNVAILEAALLWAGLACFVRGRRAWFAALVVAAACFKLLPAAFLLLLLVPPGGERREPRRFVLALLAFGLLVAGPLWIGPAAAWDGFLRHVPAAVVAGEANPGLLSAVAALATHAGRTVSEASRLAWICYGIFALLLVAASAPYLRRTWREGGAVHTVMAAVFLYVLLEPRPMAYGFMVLAPAPLVLAPRPFDGPAGRWLLVLVLCAQGLMRVARMPADSWIAVYSPSLLTLALWLLVLSAPPRPTTSARA
jgi:hypothetical protein